MKSFKLLVGRHAGQRDVTKKPSPSNVQFYDAKGRDGLPSIVQTEDDLVALFPNKFVRIDSDVPALPPSTPTHPSTAPAKAVTYQNEAIERGQGTEEEEESSATYAFGKDVTDQFSTAAKLDTLVLQDGDTFMVVKKTDVETPLNEDGPLPTAAKVKTFLAKLLKTVVTAPVEA